MPNFAAVRKHDDVIKWKHFPRYWPLVRGIHRPAVNSPHKGQWRGVLMFSLICVWINGWVNNREADDLRRYRAHYDFIVMNTDIQQVLSVCWCHLTSVAIPFIWIKRCHDPLVPTTSRMLVRYWLLCDEILILKIVMRSLLDVPYRCHTRFLPHLIGTWHLNHTLKVRRFYLFFVLWCKATTWQSATYATMFWWQTLPKWPVYCMDLRWIWRCMVWTWNDVPENS